MKQFDLVVIGSGPAGYTGAIRASQLGLRVACVEKRTTQGGTCLNEGCIPSKALLNMSHKYEEAQKNLDDFGISIKASLNLSKMLSKKAQIVDDLCKGIEGLFAKNNIKSIKGSATIINPNTIEVNDGLKTEEIGAKNIMIATGSSVTMIPGIQINGKNIITAKEALFINKVPNTLMIIGGGYIGLELGSVWRRLGADVTVIEYEDRIVPALDKEIGKKFHQLLEQQGMKFKFGHKVLEAKDVNGQVQVEIEDNNSKKKDTQNAEIVLLSVGRKAYTENLGLENIGVKIDNRGRIEVNTKYQTNIPHIYAVGDVIKGPMLAHKAEEEAIAAAENMVGQSGHVDYKIIPSVFYTDPEVASLGMTEEELKQQGIEYKVGKFPFLANSRARSICKTAGLVKILVDKKTDQVLGAHIVGQDAGNLIAEIAMAMTFSASAEDIARTCHAHPTLNEAIKEAALDVDKRTINI